MFHFSFLIFRFPFAIYPASIYLLADFSHFPALLFSYRPARTFLLGLAKAVHSSEICFKIAEACLVASSGAVAAASGREDGEGRAACVQTHISVACSATSDADN